MKTRYKVLLFFLILIGIIWGSSIPLKEWWRKRNLPTWRETTVERGEIIEVVNSTGKIKPVMSVQIGAFVSGPIDPDTPLVEFNQEVKKDDVLAIIDQRLYEADVQRDEAAVLAAKASEGAAVAGVSAAESAVSAAEATLNTRLAEVQRAIAVSKRAANDEGRAIKLASINRDFISQSEMDEVRFSNMQQAEQVNVAIAAADQARAAILQAEAGVVEAKASLSRASAAVAQAEANKTRSVLNRDYTIITSPVDGIVIDRKIEPGQTLAATFQTPELFVIAPNMREEMHVYASVDEADIGLIRDAKRAGNTVEFTVGAYPSDLFKGTIKEVRFSSTETQNVVTYPVIVSAANPDLKLLPGMTANISFQVDKKTDIVKIPNSALRFYPLAQHVREADRKILDGASSANQPGEDEADLQLSAAEKTAASIRRNTRHVWVAEGEKLKAIAVITGISDSKYTELVSGDVTEGMKLVTGVKPKEAK